MLEQTYTRLNQPRVCCVAGARWEVIEAGCGAPLLLLPGGFGIAATSFQYIDACAGHYRVLAVTYPPQLKRIAALADGIAALLAVYGIAQAHVVAGSASGAVAQVLVRRHPTRVTALILAQTGLPERRRAALARTLAQVCQVLPSGIMLALMRLAILRFLPYSDELHAFWRSHFAEVVSTQNRAALAARWHALADYDRNYCFRPSDLQHWPGRVALIEASNDGMLSPKARAKLRACYPQAQIYTLAEAGHASSVTNPAPQIALIREFLG